MDVNRESRGLCFVVMGFGKKTDFETGRVLDLDKSYRNVIKPAVEASGYKCIRADELVHSGLIDVPMYEQLLKADIVIADLSTSNKNAYYELGVRHALRPYTTIIICDDSIKNFPFDLSHVVIRQYHHLGEDIGFEEVMRFRELLTTSIIEIRNKEQMDNDSPVYNFLNGLIPPFLKEVQEKVKGVRDSHKTAASSDYEDKASTLTSTGTKTHRMLMEKADEAQNIGDWTTAKKILTQIRGMINAEIEKKEFLLPRYNIKLQEDHYILQRLVLATYKCKSPDEKSALIDARIILTLLDPHVSNDPETLGLWGAVNKKLYDLTANPEDLNEAISAYERGFYIRNDFYNGINYAFLLNTRANVTIDHAEAIADYVCARRVRYEVLTICNHWLKNNPVPSGENEVIKLSQYNDNVYWVKATIGEVYVGLGEEQQAANILKDAYAKAPKKWMKDSTEDQLHKLRALVANSPLEYINSHK